MDERDLHNTGDGVGRWLGRLSLALLMVGAALRLWQFAFNRSLWLDEAYLATSLANKELWALLTEPLDNGQAAPLGFLALSKVAFEALGRTDWSLRLVPLLTGLATLLVAWQVSVQAWRGSWARLLFVGLVACSPVLIYYSSEFKQYGGDVLVTLLIVWSGLLFDTERLRQSLLRLAIVGAVGVWFSHPSVFVLASVGLTLGVEALRMRHGRSVVGLVGVGVVWVLSFGAHYAAGIQTMAANPALKEFWLMAYAPWPPVTAGQWSWYWDNGLGLVFLAFRHVGVAHHLAMPGWTDGTTTALAVAVMAGWVLAWRGQGRMAAMLVVPIAITLVASALHLYPFRSRLILFLVPLIWMSVATAVEQGLLAIESRRSLASSGPWGVVPRMASGAVIAMGLALLAVVAVPSWVRLQSPHNQADIKGAMAYVAAHRQPGDHLMMGSWSHKAFAFYQDAYDLDDAPVYVFHRTKNAVHDGYATVRRLCSAGETGHTWLIVAHRFDRRRALLDVVQELAPVIQQWEGEGAGVYRIHFADAPYCQRYRP